MSGMRHSLPFPHYHRKEDGTTYFVVNGEINAAPTGQETIEVGGGYQRCSFDIEAALTIKDWESPSEFEPFRREVEQALGLPITLNALEKVRDAINAMECEWKSDYDYPDFLSVYPRGDTTDDGIAWSWGIDKSVWVGNDRMQQNSRNLNLPAQADAGFVAREIVAFMRGNAIKRVQWLNDFVEKCVSHIEATSATSPNATYPDAKAEDRWSVKTGFGPYDEAWSLVNTWRGK